MPLTMKLGMPGFYRIVYFWAYRITPFFGRARNCGQKDEVLNLDPIYFAHGPHPIVKVDRKLPRVTVLVVSGSRLEANVQDILPRFQMDAKRLLYIYIYYSGFNIVLLDKLPVRPVVDIPRIREIYSSLS